MIARKTAVRGVSTSSTVWAEQINLGPYAQAGLWIASDGQQTAVPYVMVVQNSLDITKSVAQWNKSTASTGDYLRVFNGDGTSVFRITGDGDIVWAPSDSLRGQLAKMRAEIADLRSELQQLKASRRPMKSKSRSTDVSESEIAEHQLELDVAVVDRCRGPSRTRR